MDGWIVVYRSLADHSIWTAEQFTRGQAWIDLLILANHKPGFVRKQGIRVDLDRGDVGYGELELAARWKWSRGKVRRFLNELKIDHMITRKIVQADGEKHDKLNSHKQDKRRFIISILNYDKYQSKKKNDDTSDDTGEGSGDEHKVVQATDKRQYKRRYKNNNDNNENNYYIPHGDADAVVETYLTKKKRVLSGKRLEAFNRFWAAFSFYKGKAEAADAWLDIPSLTDSLVETIIAAAMREARGRAQVIAKNGTPKWAQGWLTARRWEDEAEQASASRPTFDLAAMQAMVAVN
jgi:hypothetical protein